MVSLTLSKVVHVARIIQPFGPHTEAVLRFFRMADVLTAAQWRAVADRYERASREEREAVEVMAIERLLEHGVRLGQEWAAQERVHDLVQKIASAEAADDAWRDARRRYIDAVHVAVAYAVTALVARDLIDEATFTTLYAPFDGMIPLEDR